MNIRHVIASLLAILSFTCLNAQERRKLVDFNIEWGYSATLFESHNYIYYDDYGSRIPDKYTGLARMSNAYLLAGAGFNVGGKSNIGIQSGYCGIARDRNIIPLLFRYKYAFAGSSDDGAIFIAGAGVGFPVNTTSDAVVVSGSIGGGYRLVLSGKTSIDIQCTARLAYDRPEVFQKGSNRPVPAGRILRNDAFYGSLNIGLAINF